MSLDDRIRSALEQALPESPVDVDYLVAELTERFSGLELPDSDTQLPDSDTQSQGSGEFQQEVGTFESTYDPSRRSGPEDRGTGNASAGGGSGSAGGLGGLPLLGILGAVVGIGLGVALGLLTLGGGGAGSVTGAAAFDGVPVFACPGEGRVGTLHGGDRIFIVGQADGWLAVRNVRGRGETVFVDAQYVLPDEDLSNLPRRDCEEEGILTIGPFDDTTTTTEPDAVTTTTEPEATTTTTTTTTQPAPTTTTASDTTPPVISNPFVGPDEINEEGGQCPPPFEAELSAFVTDDVGVAEVVATWQISGQNFSSALTGGPNYTGVFGPFDLGTVPYVAPYYVDVAITITATDGAGNQSSETLPAVRLWHGIECSP